MKDCNGYFDTLKWHRCIRCIEQKECLEKSIAKEKAMSLN